MSQQKEKIQELLEEYTERKTRLETILKMNKKSLSDLDKGNFEGKLRVFTLVLEDLEELLK